MRRVVSMPRLLAITLAAALAFVAVVATPLYVAWRPRPSLENNQAHAFPFAVHVVDKAIPIGSFPGAFLTAGMIEWSPTASGRVDALTVQQPDFALSIDGIVGAGHKSVATAPVVASEGAPPPSGHLVIRNGTVTLTAQARPHLVLTDLTLSIDIDSRSNYTAEGSFSANGRTVRLNARGSARPLSATQPLAESVRAASQASSDTSSTWPLQITLASELAEASFLGTIDPLDKGLVGDLSVRTADARALLDWLVSARGGGEKGPAMGIVGPVRWSGGVLAFERSQIVLEGDPGVGAIAIRMLGGRPMVEGSAAFPLLDLAHVLAARGSALGDPQSWRQIGLRFPALATLDLDLRVSASQLAWNGTPIGSVAASISAHRGTVSADIAEFAFGAHRGTLELTLGPGVAPRLKARATLQSSGGDPLGTLLLGRSLIAGTTTTNLEGSAEGTSLGEMLSAVRVHGSLEAQEGKIALDVERLEKIARTRSGTRIPSDFGVAAYRNIRAEFSVRGGVLDIDDCHAETSAISAHATGRYTLEDSSIDAVVTWQPAKRAAPGPTAVQSVVVRGRSGRYEALPAHAAPQP